MARFVYMNYNFGFSKKYEFFNSEIEMIKKNLGELCSHKNIYI